MNKKEVIDLIVSSSIAPQLLKLLIKQEQESLHIALKNKAELMDTLKVKLKFNNGDPVLTKMLDILADSNASELLTAALIPLDGLLNHTFSITIAPDIELVLFVNTWEGEKEIIYS